MPVTGSYTRVILTHLRYPRTEGALRVPDYKIRYKSGSRTQEVIADSYGIYGDFFVFTRDSKDILSVAKGEVESVGLADIADPEHPEPYIG